MNLQKALKSKPLSELKEFYTFWEGNGGNPGKTEQIIPWLLEQMTDDDLVRRRLKFLSKKLLDILKFFLRSDSYSSNLQHILNSQAFSYMSQYEMEAALNALQKRGFLFERQAKIGSPSKAELGASKLLLIPEELGEILQNFLWDEEKDIYDTFSLRGYLSKFPVEQIEKRFTDLLKNPMEPGTENPLDAYCSRFMETDEVAHRIERLDDAKLRKMLDLTITEFGGVLPCAMFERIKGHYPKWDHRRWKLLLEKNLIGTVRHLSLGEYGINHFDDTLVIFHEVVEAYMICYQKIDSSRFT
ncbi:MAG: hypothetical protein ABIK28_13860, partial [Planctomycetota bacterium]